MDKQGRDCLPYPKGKYRLTTELPQLLATVNPSNVASEVGVVYWDYLVISDGSAMTHATSGGFSAIVYEQGVWQPHVVGGSLSNCDSYNAELHAITTSLVYIASDLQKPPGIVAFVTDCASLADIGNRVLPRRADIDAVEARGFKLHFYHDRHNGTLTAAVCHALANIWCKTAAVVKQGWNGDLVDLQKAVIGQPLPTALQRHDLLAKEAERNTI